MKLKLPSNIKNVLDTIEANGHEAYIVGECVRDSFLERTPKDWLIATPAKPEEIEAAFLKAPAARVAYVPDLEEYLKRSDFTVNAMAYSEKDGLLDPQNGLYDLKYKNVRCVGNADDRFDEDAILMLRAVRLAAELDFGIERETYGAICRHAEDLRGVRGIQMQEDLVGILTSPNPEKWLDLYDTGITGVILPEFDVAMNTPQNSMHHMYNVGEHTIHALNACRPDRILRLTMLLHDLGKPGALVTDDRGYDHFPGHAGISESIARDVLLRLEFDDETIAVVTKLVKYHDYRPDPEPAAVSRALDIIGEELFPLFLEVQWADNSAKSEYGLEDKFDRVQAVCDVYEQLLAERNAEKD